MSKPKTPSKPPAPPARKPNGRPPFVPTDEMRALVQAMSINQVPHADIAAAFAFFPGRMKRLSVSTLERKFKDQLGHGLAVANARVTSGLFRNATTATKQYPGGHPLSQFFWLKTRAGWKDTQHVDISFLNADISQFTDEELEDIAAGRATAELIERVKASARSSSSSPT